MFSGEPCQCKLYGVLCFQLIWATKKSSMYSISRLRRTRARRHRRRDKDKQETAERQAPVSTKSPVYDTCVPNVGDNWSLSRQEVIIET